MRLIGERDAEKRSGTMRYIGACCIWKRLNEHRRAHVEKPMRPEDCGDQSGLWIKCLAYAFLDRMAGTKIGGEYIGNGRIRR